MKVSIVIPSRNERFLAPTVNDVLRNATGDIEIIVVLDGYWPQPPLAPVPSDKRIRIIHKGKAQGMRPAINSAMAVATGQYLMKLDAHCMVSRRFDEVLKADCDKDWVVVPRRLSLDPYNWCKLENGKSPVDYHYLSYPFERPDDPKCGLHGTWWPQRARERRHILVDEEMSSQGSCWFTTRDHWERRLGGRMEPEKYGNFIQEMQEIGLKTWLGGGKLMVNKKCSYHHWHKGKDGRGYFISKREQADGADFATRYWMTDSWPDRVVDLKWLIERFWPVPGWPKDLDSAFARAKEVLR